MRLILKLIILVTVLCSYSALIIAQDGLSLMEKPSKTSQAENGPQAWKEYSSAEGGFSILFPGNPSQETQVIEAAPGVQFNLRIHRLKTMAEYSVMYADYSIPVGDPEVAKNVLDSGAKGAVASVNSELLELKEITLFGHPGRYLKERMPSGEIMRVKMLLVGQRMYQVAITTPREDGTSAEIVRAYETMADKFLNSFKLIDKKQKSAGSTSDTGFAAPLWANNPSERFVPRSFWVAS